jgi:hypothetical protein
MRNSTKKTNKVYSCPVVPTILEGDCAFEIPDELYKQFNLNAGDSVSFKKQIGDRYSMIIHRNGKEK